MKIIAIFIRTIILFFELIIYKTFKKKNSVLTHNTMVKLFCLSGGWSNDIIDFFLKKKSLNLPKSNIENYLQLGFCKKKNFLNKNIINNFKIDLSSITGYWTGDNYQSSTKEKLTNEIKSTKYYYDQDDLVKLPAVQEIIQNDEIINLARTCLESEPILYNINCWYSYPNAAPDEVAAQKWHFDMDRPKWVKFFFYIKNCHKDNGPHCFITKTHKNNGIPKKIRDLGYQRINDEMINKYFSINEVKEFTSLAGDLIIENTRGLHKGKHVLNGERLIFQIEFATTLFGGDYKKIKINKKEYSDEFFNNIKSKEHIYQAFEIYN